MRGNFKKNDFDNQTLSLFMQRLKESGLEFEHEWKKGNKSADIESANSLILKHNDKVFFHTFKNKGSVIPEKLPKSQRLAFYQAIQEYKLYQKPDFLLSMLGVFAFTALFSVITMPAMLDRSSTLATVVFSLLGVSVIGFILFYMQASETSIEKDSNHLVPLLIIIPGVASLSPSALLLLPLIHTTLTLSHWNKVKLLIND